MKMPEPTMPPMTIIVASNMFRRRGGVSVAKGARIYQKSTIDSRKLKESRPAALRAFVFVFDSSADILVCDEIETSSRSLWRAIGTDHQRAGIGEAVRRSAAVSQHFVHSFG